MSGNLDGNKPPVQVEFTKEEQIELQKTASMIQRNFLVQHQEIAAPCNSDLAQMIRQEKHMYANLGIAYAVNAIAAMEKVKKQ